MRSVSLNPGWLFRTLPGLSLDALPPGLPEGQAERVDLPHTWYRDDNQYRGLALYEKTVSLEAVPENAFLSFSGADQRCRVLVNGVPIGEHRGGYSRFRLPVPREALASGALHIQVLLENRLNEDISPCFGDFTVFGGLYRDVDLLLTGDAYFDPCFFGADGLILRTEVDGEGRGVVHLEPHAVCPYGDAAIEYRLTDAAGETVATLTAGPRKNVRLPVEHPRLWDGPDSPALYTLTARLTVNGEIRDSVILRTGFRRVEITPDRGLLLNGRPTQLRGVARHQDRAGAFCAVTPDQVREDYDIIKEMGANAVRLSHYQHPQAAYDCCDENGLLCWAEIPMLKMTESQALLANAKQQLSELIFQNIHHPSVFCWGIQNEIAMFRDAPFMHENCRALHALVRSLDPFRCSAAANLYPLKAASPLNAITDIVGYNVYFGWYYGDMDDYGPYLDKFHAARPELPLGISEYGVDANLALHSEDPRVKDYSEEYQALWHETVYPQIKSRPWLWGSFVWNMFDFSSARRNEGGQRFLNAKGLVTHDRRTRKDAFYYYKARWTDAPFVHLCGKRFEKRAQEKIDVKCYTNQPRVTLTVNGEARFEAETKNGTALFRGVPLRMGENRAEVSAGGRADETVWVRVTEPESGYRLPDADAGGPVRNWFLAEDDTRKEGFYSIQDTANDLLTCPETRKILEKFIPGLVRVMTETAAIPLGLTLKSILSHDPDETLDVKALNRELNQVKNDEA